jgi:hypothetical protein
MSSRLFIAYLDLEETLLLVSNSQSVALLVFHKNYFVFKFAHSIDHYSLIKYRIPSSYTLLNSAFQDDSFDVKS